ncbi:MAG: winged helix-turn-helix transcriptional regulator [Rhodobacter sp.]|jgi:DNA-binding MarR family transcriptional regulator|nr:winged helix-turn-helix transcriptional regulator [Rhodobacter sp.]MCA3519221.1 winged helix-turn-helix transcriptional regulator [Rhodobacter sp.]MCA3523454.1 winged helix-turn-helix transcriptional regulator [Rhodobacter sp.]MCA3526501.1 winged helix-turn-helix transcriptional regulator [Rhodobacter sp.]MCA3530194.1 winged helix-turn-helix transcriptional regulator [Rhodobacter sp.]
MPDPTEFDLERFLPYLLNQAAEATSKSFQATYKAAYGMTRTQWRVLANLGKFGAMTARDICAITHVEKTKVSRAVSTLEENGLLSRATSPLDRRAEILSLTDRGREVFADLGQKAIDYDRALRARIGPKIAAQLDERLRRIIARAGADGDGD